MDAIVAVVVIGATLLPTGDPSGHRAVLSPLFQSPALVVFPVAAAVVLLFRRRWPTAVLAGTVIVLATGLIANSTMLTLVVPVVIAAFGVALRASRRTTLMATTVTVTVLIVLEVLVSKITTFDVRVLPLATVVAAAAIAGDATRTRRAYIAAIMERALRAEQNRDSEARRRVAEERLRIARDLHDTVAHQITVISLHANVATESLGANPQLAEQSLSTIRRAAALS
jgi:signal transduction histidine kinase